VNEYQVDHYEYQVDHSETALHELSDNIGVRSSVLRLALLSTCSAYQAGATVDDNLAFEDAWAGASFASQAVALAAGGGTDTVHLGDHQAGAVVLTDSPYSARRPCAGFRYAISGAGADDDVVVHASLAGVLPDGKALVRQLKGEGIFEVPEGTVVSSSFILTITNQTATAVVVHFSGFAKAGDSSASKFLRESMADKGIPVGAARGSRLMESLDIADKISGVRESVREGLRGAAAGAVPVVKAAAAKAVKGALSSAISTRAGDFVDKLGTLGGEFRRFGKRSRKALSA